MYRCSEEDFYRLKKEYNEKNNSFKKVFIFHVGQAAGFYSELGAMLSAMMYCYCNQIKFVLYADDEILARTDGKIFLSRFVK